MTGQTRVPVWKHDNDCDGDDGDGDGDDDCDGDDDGDDGDGGDDGDDRRDDDDCGAPPSCRTLLLHTPRIDKPHFLKRVRSFLVE